MSSKEFIDLSIRLGWLKQHLLPFRFDATGTYHFAEKVIIRASAYRVLCHAEFESYIEGRAITVAMRALERWKKDGFYSAPLMAMVAFCDTKMPRPPEYVQPKPKDQKDWDDLVSPNKRIERAVRQFVNSVEEENHGIREKNLLRVLIPIGVDLRELKAADLADIDNFGKARGSAAHNSSVAYVKSGLDPRSEFDRVSRVLRCFSDIDALLDKAAASIEP